MPRLHDETNANTTRFSCPYGGMNFIAAILIFFQIAKKQGGALNFKELSQNVGRTKLAENLRASPFNKELSNETTFSQIHLAWRVPLKWL
jgi:hypothetical protein